MPFAGQKGYLRLIQVLLKKGFSMDEVDSEGNSALHLALLEGQVDAVKFILGCSTRSVTGTIDDSIPLSVITESRSQSGRAQSESHNPDQVERINRVIDEHERTSLHLAAGMGSLASVEALLDCGASIEFLSLKGTPLEIAVESGNVAMVKLLLEKGAAPGAAGLKGPPLHIALFRADEPMIEALLLGGADPNAPFEFQHLPFNHKKGIWGLYGGVPKLLDHQERALMLQPLHVAIFRDRSADVLKMLLRHGADVDGYEQPIGR